ncbi:hypothetical protein WN943_006951 [Citrus x changshan-huyou]
MACIGLSQLETFVFGNQTCFIVMGNLFCSGYRIHRHFALKGSSHGGAQQIERDCEFFEAERIMDYSLMAGLHFHDKTAGANIAFTTGECDIPSTIPSSAFLQQQNMMANAVPSADLVGLCREICIYMRDRDPGPRQELQEHHSAMEETKPDIIGLLIAELSNHQAVFKSVSLAEEYRVVLWYGRFKNRDSTSRCHTTESHVRHPSLESWLLAFKPRVLNENAQLSTRNLFLQAIETWKKKFKKCVSIIKLSSSSTSIPSLASSFLRCTIALEFYLNLPPCHFSSFIALLTAASIIFDFAAARRDYAQNGSQIAVFVAVDVARSGICGALHVADPPNDCFPLNCRSGICVLQSSTMTEINCRKSNRFTLCNFKPMLWRMINVCRLPSELSRWGKSQNPSLHTRQGTRPTDYHVLHNEIGFSANDLHELLHFLSYVYQRSTTAVSVAVQSGKEAQCFLKEQHKNYDVGM